MGSYTKIYKREKDQFRNLSGSAILVYMHLKDDCSYFCKQKGNNTFMDMQSKIGETLGMSKSTVQRAIRDLADAGLVITFRKGKTNHYLLPYNEDMHIADIDENGNWVPLPEYEHFFRKAAEKKSKPKNEMTIDELNRTIKQWVNEHPDECEEIGKASNGNDYLWYGMVQNKVINDYNIALV